MKAPIISNKFLPKYKPLIMIGFKNIFPQIELGDIFASIGVRELQSNSSEAFATFAECHRLIIYKIHSYYHYNIFIHFH